MQDSIFTKIIKREIPSDIIFEDKDVMVIKDINPLAPIHLLIFPKRQIATLNELTEKDSDLISKIILVATKMAKDFKVDQTGYRLVMNCNEYAGQTVYHIHCHLLAGKKLKFEA